jgi:GDP-mannose 6-dehydrogenase
MRVCVIGLGYVGAVSAACLARDGHEVLGIDLDPTKLRLLSNGKAPIIEEGIEEVTREAAESGRLTVTEQLDAAIAEHDLIFICVGTPSAPNGSQDLTAVRRVAAQIGEALKSCEGFPVVVLRSTVYPGTTEDVVKPVLEEHSGGKMGADFGLCFQPEFLREGSSIKDFYNPPFTVVGSPCERSIETVRKLFGRFHGDFVNTGFAEAELLKITCNVFHALKISFANEVGRLARSLGVDSREVMSLVCRDKSLNISPAYLKPGFAYGGSCLPKDLRAMLYLAKMHDVDLPVMQGVRQTNDVHIKHTADIVMKSGARKVGMVGLSFKPGTDDLRESPLVTLAETLIGKGYNLRIHDPAVNLARLIGSNRRFIEQTIPHIESMLTDDLKRVFEHAEVLIVGQNHSELPELLRMRGASAPVVIDLIGLKKDELGQADCEGVCW